MSLTDAQVASLNEALLRKHVSQRQGAGGKSLNYLEAHYVKRTLNRIFGYDGWSYTLDELRCVGTELVEKNGRKGARVGYVAAVTLTVGETRRGDVGYGDAVEYGGQITPHELAAKEAVSDALKRCAASWGDQFGLVLYDKDRTAA